MMAEHRLLMEHLEATAADISLRLDVQSNFSKSLLLSSASYYEHLFAEALVGLYEEAYPGIPALAEFVRDRATGRRYSQLFSWGGGNANSFFKMFGNEFSTHMRNKAANDSGFSDAIRAFLDLGDLRNQLVHGNYAAFSLGKTFDEVYDLHLKAGRFVDEFFAEFREFISR